METPGIGIRVSILKDSDGNCSNGGISSRFDEALLVLPEGGPFSPEPDCPAIVIRQGPLGTINACPAEQVCPGEYAPLVRTDAVGPMMGGCYVATSDSRFREECKRLLGHSFYGAVALHDRYETTEQYRANSID